MQSELGQIDFRRHQIAHNRLLGLDWLSAIDDQEIKVGAHGEVLFQNAALENAETFVGIGGKLHVHARLEVFQLRASIQNALQGNFQRRFEEKDEVGQRRETINPAHPFSGAAANGVARKRGENIAVAQDDVTGAQEGKELALVTVREIRGVNEAEGGWGKQFAFFALGRGVFDEGGGIPFAEKNLEALEFEPAFDEVNLGGFAGAVQTLDGDQAAWQSHLRKIFHPRFVDEYGGGTKIRKLNFPICEVERPVLKCARGNPTEWKGQYQAFERDRNRFANGPLIVRMLRMIEELRECSQSRANTEELDT